MFTGNVEFTLRKGFDFIKPNVKPFNTIPINLVKRNVFIFKRHKQLGFKINLLLDSFNINL